MLETFDEAPSVGSLTIVLGWTLTALALLSVILYTWSRTLNRNLFHGFDDIILFVSVLLSLALMSATTWAVVIEGQGQHQSAESHSQFELVAKAPPYSFAKSSRQLKAYVWLQ